MKTSFIRPRRVALATLLTLAMGAATVPVFAQGAWPAKPVRIVVPFAPGGTTDILARAVAPELSKAFGQTFVVENRAGAAGNLGADIVAKSPADGYTIFLAATSVMATNVAMFSKLPYDPITSFAPVSLLTMQPLLIAVTPALPVSSLGELFALARSKPGQLNFAGTGASASLPLQHLLHLAGVKLQEIPYAGGGPGLTALIAGQVEVMPVTLGTVYPQVLAKKIRGLAVTSATRSSLAPELPTVAELGFPGYSATIWNGLVVPSGTPRDIIDRLNRATIKVMSSPELKAQFTKAGIEVATSTPEKLGEHIRAEIVHWKKVASDSGIKPE